MINTGQDTVGALVGLNKGRIAASYVTGSVTANTNVGGLVGTAQRGSYIVASYATAPVVCRFGGQYSTGSGLWGGNGAGCDDSVELLNRLSDGGLPEQAWAN